MARNDRPFAQSCRRVLSLPSEISKVQIRPVPCVPNRTDRTMKNSHSLWPSVQYSTRDLQIRSSFAHHVNYTFHICCSLRRDPSSITFNASGATTPDGLQITPK